MDILQIVFLGILTAILYVILKDLHPSIAYLLVIVSGIIIFISIIEQISAVFEFIHFISGQANIEHVYVETILKVIGIAYIVEIGASMTRDAGLSSLATKIELAGKIFIIILAIPIIKSLIETILAFLPQA
ncbi:MAG TPA: stage III sporulation protein AD [Bacillota bacterium]|nr:stage III sporulation protein AD [Bacillota bacterium]